SVLVGRSPEKNRIELLLKGARDGRSGALVLRGEAGVGKTALLDDARARAAGFLTLKATGVESEAEITFAGVQQLVLPVLASLSELPRHQSRALAIALALEAGPVPDRLLVSAG